MKKCLLLIALLVCTQLQKAGAQKLTASSDSLFFAPDTVCINQPVTLKSNVFNALSYYWSFCSGYLMNAPTGTNLGNTFNLHLPGNIDIVNDSGTYYGFVVNTQTRQFLRLNFGNNLGNIPSVTNFGDLTSGLPVFPTSLFILKDTFSHNWHIFVSGGYDSTTSSLARIDFGRHMSNNHPNIANFGNHTGLLNYPKGIFVAQDGDNNWWGYLVNRNTSELIRMDFSFNVSNTPLMASMGNPGTALDTPSDLAAIRDQGKWYMFVTNYGNSTLARIDLGTTLDTLADSIVGNNLGNFLFRILKPSSISLNKDCGNLHAYIVDSTSSQLVGISMPAAVGPYDSVDYGVLGGMNYSSSISSILRDGDNLYGFITNPRDSTLTRINFMQCVNSTIPSFAEVTPPTYRYNAPGVYNIYYVIDQGLPTMQVNCKPITVLPVPPIYMNTDTAICIGDTIRLYAISSMADSIRWTNTYNIDTTYLYRDSVRVYPRYSTSYPVTLHYPFGCIIDTYVNVRVKKVVADAGPDRWIKDGATTTLGGPYTSHDDTYPLAMTQTYQYYWSPYQFLSDTIITNPFAYPPFDFTYYLTVSDTIMENTQFAVNEVLTCSATDTVVVHVLCGDFYLPNAFAPNSSSPAVARFGIINNEIIKLNYLRIYDRWGNLVFETTDPTKGWDGTYNDKPMPVGVYVWEADGFCKGGKPVKKTGNVSLLR